VNHLIRTKGVPKKLESNLTEMIQLFVDELPSRLKMESAELIMERQKKVESNPASKPAGGKKDAK